MHELKVRVIYGDTDQMGVVYHANYLRYFEMGRSELLRDAGGRYRDFEQSGHFLPVVEASCRYRLPARYDDLLVVRTTLTAMRRTSLTFDYEIARDESPELLATGRTVHACLNREGKVVRLPGWLTDTLERVERPRR